MFDLQAAVYKFFPKLVSILPDDLVELFINFLKSLLHINTFNAIFKKNHHLSGLPFVDNLLENLNISCTVNAKELQNIPATGRLIVIANHITGGSDALSLIQIISSKRENKQVKLMVNGMLMGVKQAAPFMIPVDNISGSITKKSFIAVNEALENNEAIIIFPAGVVDRLTLKGIKDVPWKASFLKIAIKTASPILPIRITGRNSIMFYILSILLPKKMTGLLLPREFAIAGKLKPLHLHIGKVIPVESFSNKKISTKQYLNIFYEHLYRLGTNKDEILRTEVTIGQPRNKKLLKEEVQKAEYLGMTNNGKKIILADSQHAPTLISELGRVRELSFRAIGGGTGTARDNDHFDNHYKHLILWDDNDLEVVGAYRIGICKDIIDSKGKEGLYTSNLCNFSENFKDYCNNSVELGRSFVQPKYWGSRAFDSLWQAVTVFLAHNPHIQYTYGVVTINADTPSKAVAALVYFYSHHFSCPTKMMQAKQPYILQDNHKEEFQELFKDLSYKDGFTVLKKYLKDLGTVVPTLFKQYIELYEEGAVRYFDFSVNDKLFGVVEGFIISDNYRMKKAVQERNLKNFNQTKTRDPLTMLNSRIYFNEIIDSITKYQRKSDIDFALGMLMINDENYINDKNLVKVSKSLTKVLRENDITARCDDHKFIFILKNVTKDEVTMILLKLKNAMSVECSFGATLYIASENTNDTFMRAHDAMLKAQSDSEDKVVVH